MQHTARYPQIKPPSEPEWVNRIASTIAAAVTAQVKQQLTAEATSTRSPYMSVPEASNYMRCKPQRVYDLLTAGHLDRYKDGVRVLIRRDQIEIYLNALEHTRAGARQAMRGAR